MDRAESSVTLSAAASHPDPLVDSRTERKRSCQLHLSVGAPWVCSAHWSSAPFSGLRSYRLIRSLRPCRRSTARSDSLTRFVPVMAAAAPRRSPGSHCETLLSAAADPVRRFNGCLRRSGRTAREAARERLGYPERNALGRRRRSTRNSGRTLRAAGSLHGAPPAPALPLRKPAALGDYFLCYPLVASVNSPPPVEGSRLLTRSLSVPRLNTGGSRPPPSVPGWPGPPHRPRAQNR
jgi:hypothetical protein